MGVVERGREGMAVMALHDALRNVCLNSDWQYAIFWTIRPRPRSRGGAGSKAGEEGSFMLMWEDGYYQSAGCFNSANDLKALTEAEEEVSRANGSTKPIEDGEEDDPLKKAFRKMSIQLYNYGEGLMGKVASDKCHKWVFRESADPEVGPLSYWQSSFDSHPPEWIDQFSAGIQTIAVIQAGHGLLQLGSCKVVGEDLHFVLRMRYTFESLESYPGCFLWQSCAPTKSRIFSGPSAASPSCWLLGHNSSSFLQGSDFELSLGMPNHATTTNLELLAHRSYDTLPSSMYYDLSHPIIEKSATHAIHKSDYISDNVQVPAAPSGGGLGLKRMSASTSMAGRRLLPFPKDRLSPIIASSLKLPILASPEGGHASQNVILETSSSRSFPPSMFLRSPSNSSLAASMSNLDVYNIQSPQEACDKMSATTSNHPVQWTSIAVPNQADYDFNENPKSPRSSQPHPQIPSFPDSTAQHSKVYRTKEQFSDRFQSLVIIKKDDRASQAAPETDANLPVWVDHHVQVTNFDQHTRMQIFQLE